jgi:LuxR family transcriptional regulator, maltose regulon positive regulatory protein
VKSAAALRLGHTEFAVAVLGGTVALLGAERMRFALMLIPRRDLDSLRALARDRGLSSAWDVLSAAVDGPGIPDVIPELHAPIVLTERERVVLGGLVKTGNLAEISAELFVSTNTVKSQLRSLCRKLEVGSRDEALLAASERRLIHL